MEEQIKQQNILILGGTNFMGKQLFTQLSKYIKQQKINSNKNIHIYYVNRGTKYWNGQAQNQHPQFIHYYGDRKDHSDFTKLIQFINKNIGITAQNPWKAVVDFSAFKWRDLQSVIKAVKGKVNKYIFISSQSIYNTSINKLNSPVSQQEFDIERQYQSTKTLDKKIDKYGYNKMKCQLYLQRTKYVSHISLRLPDVIGPYDNTDRFWCYVKWIQKSKRYPIPLNEKDKNDKLNFVYSVDIAQFIIKIIKEHCDKNDKTCGSYNLRFQQTPTLKEFIKEMSNAMEISNINFRDSNAKSSNNFYPSTSFGYINCEKAQKQLGWKPQKLKKAIQDSVKFFIKHGDDYPDQKKDVQKKFKQQVIDDYN